MRLSDVQNLLGKTLDAQAIYQQSLAQSEIATRQLEKNLANERERQNAQIAESEASVSGDGAGLNVNKRLDAETKKRYRLAWKNGLGASIEIEQNLPSSRSSLDINA
jgi:hypothetical protein